MPSAKSVNPAKPNSRNTKTNGTKKDASRSAAAPVGQAKITRPKTAPPMPSERLLPTQANEPLLPPPSLMHRGWKRITALALIGFIGLALVYVVGAGVAVYAGVSNSWVTRTSDIIPYPAAIEGRHAVPYSELLDFDQALSSYFTALKDFNPNLTPPSAIQIKANALDELLRQRVLRQLAQSYHVTISDLEIEEQVKKLVAQAGNEQSVTSAISKLYGWSLDEYRERIIVPYLLRQHVQEQLAADDSLDVNQQANKKAQDALEQLKDGANFSDLAQTVSEDVSSRSAGGDLGFVKRGDHDKAFDDAAFALEKGKYSDIIRTTDGFAILYAVDKKTVPAAEAGGSPTDEVQIRQILLRTADIDATLTSSLRTATVFAFVRGIRWDGTSGHIVPR